MSKGSVGRPFSVTNEEYSNRWDAIFGRDNDSQKNKEKDMEFVESNTTRPDRCSDNSKGQTGQTKDA